MFANGPSVILQTWLRVEFFRQDDEFVEQDPGSSDTVVFATRSSRWLQLV